MNRVDVIRGLLRELKDTKMGGDDCVVLAHNRIKEIVNHAFSSGYEECRRLTINRVSREVNRCSILNKGECDYYTNCPWGDVDYWQDCNCPHYCPSRED